MNLNNINILEMINLIKEHNLDKLKEENNSSQTIVKICRFIVNLFEEYKEEIYLLNETTVRFCDYYDAETLHNEEIIEYFQDNYEALDKEQMTNVFLVYVILKNAREIIYNYELCNNLEILYELLDSNNYFEDLLFTINYLENRKIQNNELDNEYEKLFNGTSKYKILFTGFTEEDLEELDKQTKKTLIRKIASQLAKNEVIPLVESIGHVKDLYDFPIFRIHLARDYRIAFIRKENVTALLGVSLKTGKDMDYKKYDSVARKKELVYEEIEQFSKGTLPNDSKHYKVLSKLHKFYNKEMNDEHLSIGSIEK